MCGAWPSRAASRGDRESADPDVVVGENDDGSGVEIIGYRVEIPEQRGGLVLGSAVALPEQDEARESSCGPGQKLTEVAVCRDQNTVFTAGCGQHLIVNVSCQTTIRHVDDIVSGGDEQLGKTRADALVQEKLHAVVRSGTCRSLTAAAANSSAARTSSADSWG